MNTCNLSDALYFEKVLIRLCILPLFDFFTIMPSGVVFEKEIQQKHAKKCKRIVDSEETNLIAYFNSNNGHNNVSEMASAFADFYEKSPEMMGYLGSLENGRKYTFLEFADIIQQVLCIADVTLDVDNSYLLYKRKECGIIPKTAPGIIFELYNFNSLVSSGHEMEKLYTSKLNPEECGWKYQSRNPKAAQFTF